MRPQEPERVATRPVATVAELMNPRSVAVIGASEDQTKFGGRLLRMLIRHGYGGTIYPINPGRETLFGLRAYPSIAATPEAPDMVVMALPQPKVKAEIEAAAARGARGGIIVTAKFSDAGAEGAALEREIVLAARAHAMRLIGPNCLGVISPANHVVLCSSPALDVDTLPVGSIGLVSQSGALMATIFDRALDVNVGFSHCVSVGNQADLELCDFVEYLIDDERTNVICTYIEGLKAPRRFAALAHRAREAGKPWLAVKAGRTEAGSRAAYSHTASIAGSHAVLASVCRDENVTLLDDTGAMITLAAAIARHPGGRARRVAVLTTSGGGGALAADALEARGLEMARFAPETAGKLAQVYSPGQGGNPIDFGGRKFEEAINVGSVSARIVAADPDTDALLFVLTTAPMLGLLADDIAGGLLDENGHETKASFFVMQPGGAADGARDALRARGFPFTNHVGEAVDALAAWASRGRFEPRSVATRPAGLAPPAAAPRGTFDEAASKALIASCGVPVNASSTVASADAAVAAAEAIGYPVVLKIVSPDIVHKSDAGGVVTGLGDATSVRAAYDRIVAAARTAVPAARIDGVSVQATARGPLELIVGARRDPQFGPIVVFGAGGVLVELLPARAIATAPLAADDARRLLRELPVWPVLAGFRGRALALEAVVDAIVRVSWLAHDLRDADFELDVNPLIVDEHGCCAVDARLRAQDAR
ncbi:MAG: acetate--CoA ligase family protein [Burkholderiaceae bacterium]